MLSAIDMEFMRVESPVDTEYVAKHEARAYSSQLTIF